MGLPKALALTGGEVSDFKGYLPIDPDSYLGFIHIVSIRLWMREFVNRS